MMMELPNIIRTVSHIREQCREQSAFLKVAVIRRNYKKHTLSQILEEWNALLASELKQYFARIVRVFRTLRA